MKNIAFIFLIVTVFFLGFFPGCAKNNETTVILGSYTATREAYIAIIPLFQEYWYKKTGKTVRVKQSYLGSGAQSRAIAGGFEADIAALSLESDVESIAKAGLIKHDWKSLPHRGMITNSVVVLAVREGNPKKILDWVDITKSGLAILTPNPKSSGGAMWNVLAVYGAAKRGKVLGYDSNDEGARKFLKDVFKNVTVLDKGARESIINFEKGIGDVLITYENEMLAGRKQGQSYEEIMPSSTILIENPVAVVDQYAEKHGVKEVAEAFRDFLWTKKAQKVFSDFGFRLVDPEVAGETSSQFPSVPDLWKAEFLGDWKQLIPNFFGPSGVFTKIMEEIQREK